MCCKFLQDGNFRIIKNIKNTKQNKMKKIQLLGAIALVMIFTACSQKKEANESSGAKDGTDVLAPDAPVGDASLYSATFIVNNKTYTFSEVGAVGFQKQNSITLNATGGAEGETLIFTIVLKNIREGQQKFSELGNSVAFTNDEANYSNAYKADCTDEDAVTDGKIIITKLIDYTPEKDGRLEGNIEGQLSITRPVQEYPCGNGKSSNRKTELVSVKGSFVARYINTKEVPL
jgi:hypothetical protein